MSDLGNLQISKDELDDLLDFDIITSLGVDIYRAFVLRNNRYILSVLLTQLFSFFLSLIFIMPPVLIMLRNSGSLPNNATGFTKVFAIAIAISILCLLIWNLYLWRKTRQLKSLASLMEKLEKYNNLIESIKIIDTINTTRQFDEHQDYQNRQQEIIEALTITKDSLINALKVEKIIRKHQKLITNPYQLLTNLENNLVNLMSFENYNQTTQYGQLLTETLQLGLSVHKEIKKLQNQNFN